MEESPRLPLNNRAMFTYIAEGQPDIQKSVSRMARWRIGGKRYVTLIALMPWLIVLVLRPGPGKERFPGRRMPWGSSGPE